MARLAGAKARINDSLKSGAAAGQDRLLQDAGVPAGLTIMASGAGPADGADPADHGAGASRPIWRLNFVPSDTNYVNQYQYGMMGDIEAVWDDYTGAGVHVGIYDSGVEYTHPDLADNYDASRHVTYNSTVHDGGVNGGSGGHGTHVAGIIAADADGVNAVGVAHGASITGINIFDGSSALDINAGDPSGFFSALDQAITFDVINNSWGTPYRFFLDNNPDLPGSFGESLNQGWLHGVEEGRGGLGTIIIKSAGNDNCDIVGEGSQGTFSTIVVAAARADGFTASYSNFGANILVTAPGGAGWGDSGGGILSTDMVGIASGDYSDGDFASISGTSMSGPQVAGLAALLLEANPDLGWRDVQEILAYSARQTGSGVGSGPGANENNAWFENGAGDWNGGGLHFSEDYGYGMIDTYAAVRMAEVWTMDREARTSANLVSLSSGALTVETDYGATFDQSFNFTVTESLDLEHLALGVSLDRSQFWQMNIWLTSPEGTEVQLANTSGLSDADSFYETTDLFEFDNTLMDRLWNYGAQAFRGEDTAGTWTVRIVDAENRSFSGFAGATQNYTINSLELNFSGATASADDLYIYTDAYADMTDVSRWTLSDVDGGYDVINAAAVTGPCLFDLSGVLTSRFVGAELFVAGGTIESVFSGDGADHLIGNDLDNWLYGGRDIDTLDGGAGADTLEGGEGDDTYYADSDDILRDTDGYDTVYTVSDSFLLAAGLEMLIGTAGTGQWLTGNREANFIVGGEGGDTLDGGKGDDLLIGGEGVDTASYALILNRGVNVDLNLAGAQDTRGGGFDALETIENLLGTNRADRLIGNSGDNVLTGSGGDDRLYGGGGHDLLDGGEGTDILTGGLGGDTLSGGASQDFFMYRSVAESTASAIDRIIDLDAFDIINLRAIDARIDKAGNQAFRLVDALTGVSGQAILTYRPVNDVTSLKLDVDGDGVGDMVIYMSGDQREFAGFIF